MIILNKFVGGNIMSFMEELANGVIKEGEIAEEVDLMEAANIDGYDVPSTLATVRSNIKNVLSFRNDNKDLNPNCEEIARLTLELNNALAREMSKAQPDVQACESLTESFDVLYHNVVEHALVGKKIADRQSSLYKLLATMKASLESPKRVEEEEKRYLQTLCSVNFFQREKLQQGEIVAPNQYEQAVIGNVEHELLPEDLQPICVKMEQDIATPEIMRDTLSI